MAAAAADPPSASIATLGAKCMDTVHLAPSPPRTRPRRRAGRPHPLTRQNDPPTRPGARPANPRPKRQRPAPGAGRHHWVATGAGGRLVPSDRLDVDGLGALVPSL